MRKKIIDYEMGKKIKGGGGIKSDLNLYTRLLLYLVNLFLPLPLSFACTAQTTELGLVGHRDGRQQVAQVQERGF